MRGAEGVNFALWFEGNRGVVKKKSWSAHRGIKKAPQLIGY